MIANRLAPHRRLTTADETASDDIWRPSSLPLAARYLAALVMTALAAVVAVGVDARVTIPNLSLLFVLPVIIAALAFGLGSSLLSAVLGALAYNYFLTEPRYTLQVDDPANIWAIALLFVVGVIASGVASTARRWANEAARLGREGVLLRSYLGKINAAGGPNAIAAVSADALAALFGVPVMVAVDTDIGVQAMELRGDLLPGEAEREAARHAIVENQHVLATEYPFVASRFDFWPVPARHGMRVAIGLAFDPDDRPAMPGTVAETVAGAMALALDRETGGN